MPTHYGKDHPGAINKDMLQERKVFKEPVVLLRGPFEPNRVLAAEIVKRVSRDLESLEFISGTRVPRVAGELYKLEVKAELDGKIDSYYHKSGERRKEIPDALDKLMLGQGYAPIGETQMDLKNGGSFISTLVERTNYQLRLMQIGDCGTEDPLTATFRMYVCFRKDE